MAQGHDILKKNDQKCGIRIPFSLNTYTYPHNFKMNIRNLHPWDLSPRDAISIQTELRNIVICTGKVPRKLKLIGGADVSYSKNTGKLYAGVVVLEYPSFKIMEQKIMDGEAEFPYVPGLLTFREGKLLVRLFESVQNVPDAFIFDGQGYAHPRRFGIACHLGVIIDVPSAGCAKTRLIGTHGTPGKLKGAKTDLVHRNEKIGTVLRTRDNVNPVFISPGHKLGFDEACELVLKCCTRYRLPEPVRVAHRLVNEYRLQEE